MVHDSLASRTLLEKRLVARASKLIAKKVRMVDTPFYTECLDTMRWRLILFPVMHLMELFPWINVNVFTTDVALTEQEYIQDITADNSGIRLYVSPPASTNRILLEAPVPQPEYPKTSIKNLQVSITFDALDVPAYNRPAQDIHRAYNIIL